MFVIAGQLAPWIFIAAGTAWLLWPIAFRFEFVQMQQPDIVKRRPSSVEALVYSLMMKWPKRLFGVHLAIGIVWLIFR